MRLVVIGGSGHGKVVLDTLDCERRHVVVGLLDAAIPRGSLVMGRPVLGQEEDLPRLMEQLDIEAGMVAIGDNWTRARVMERLKTLAPGFRFAAAVHPSARVAQDVVIGDGTVVMAGAVIQPGCRLGVGAIVNTSASLDHDGLLGDYSSLAPGVVAGGNLALGAYSAVGLGALIRHGIRIGEHTVVGAGSLVLHEIPSHVVAYGAPARIIRSRAAGELYL